MTGIITYDTDKGDAIRSGLMQNVHISMLDYKLLFNVRLTVQANYDFTMFFYEL